MQSVESLVYRKLTLNDWQNINRPKDSISGGGGQLYIDFPTSSITENNWLDFFKNIGHETVTNGPKFVFKMKSLGAFQGIQMETIYQRRSSTFSITEQNIHSTNTKRVFAWTPSLTGFPEPPDINNITSVPNSLYIFIVRLTNNEFWAGWFEETEPNIQWYVNDKLKSIFTHDDGYLTFQNELIFDTSEHRWPFKNIS